MEGGLVCVYIIMSECVDFCFFEYSIIGTLCLLYSNLCSKNIIILMYRSIYLWT